MNRTIYLIAMLLAFTMKVYGQSSEELYQEGQKYFNSKNYTKALECFSQAAAGGYEEARVQIGLMYYSGWGVEKNYRTALNYLTISADNGHTFACSIVGSMYLLGKGINKDYNKAYKYLQKAAGQGNGLALYY